MFIFVAKISKKLTITAKKAYRICIVSEQLAEGGAERCSAVLSNFFVANNCNVHHVVVIDKIEYQYSGEILNLGKLKKDSFSLSDRLLRFNVLRKFFTKNKFDFIIDTRVINRQWQEFFIAKCIYNAPKIKMVHSFMTHLYFPKKSFLARNIYSSFDKIISVSQSIETKVQNEYSYKNTKTIYNPIDFNEIDEKSSVKLDIDFDYILAVGNMKSNVKQFDHLIECYSKSNLPIKKIKLIIIGEGRFKESHQELVKSYNLESEIVFLGKINNPFPYYKKAFFTILTSKNEGFPTVLLESLACQTPVVTYDCQSGPNEIIQNNENGILVENQNKQKLINSINEMIENKDLYLHCKSNARASVERFSLENIGNQWLQLFNDLSK